MKNRILTAIFCILSISLSAQTNKLSLDNGWRFFMGDISMPAIKNHESTYSNAKAGKAWGAADPGFDDTEWRLLNLPHDWAVEQGFDSTENVSQGFRKRGIGWYRRNFKVDPKDRGKHLELQFDGIATYAQVWVNGTVVHRNWCGYTSFYIDITPYVKYGDELNNISIRVDANAMEGWWYEGAGIYRHTWLVKSNPVHIITDGVYANPVKLTANKWMIPVEVTIENSGKTNETVEVASFFTDPKNKTGVSVSTKVQVNALGQAVAKINLPVTNPDLWWVDHPNLYQVKTMVKKDGQLLDASSVNCGFRTIKFTADSGFYLNDVWMKLKGTCNHQDHAGVGVAVPNSLWEFRIKKLKEMGSNAFRCAHNPPSKEFLDACDKLGLLVMDENRNFNASPEYQRQLEWMLRRDRNHPSIILWSVFNEEPMQGSEIGYEMVRRMSAVVKSFDTTRPVTAAMNGGQFTPLNVSKAVDVVGFNYNIGTYDRFHKENPTVPMTSSEDVSGLMQRGVFVTNKKKNLLASYDLEKPSWGSTHRVGWKAVNERKFMAGCFIWTGFDYHGEPTPYEWPTAGSNFGIMDLCGFPKTAFYLHQAQWVTDKHILYIAPHWNWPADSIGKKIKVMAFSNAEKVKLLLNGNELGEQTVDKYEMNTWEVPYQSGTLEAIGYTNGKEVSRFKVETTGEPAAIELIANRNSIEGDGQDAVPVSVQVVDAKGRVVPTANLPIEFEVSGAANIIGLGNGDPNSHEAEKGNKRSVYNGLAQVILQSKFLGNGPVVLTAKSMGLKSTSVTIQVKITEGINEVPAEFPRFTISNGWRLSPFSVVKPDPNQDIAGNDMNSWSPVRANQLQDFKEGNFAVYRAGFKPYAAQRNNGGQIILKNVVGKAEVWIDKKLVATKSNFEKGDITAVIEPSQKEQKISVLIETEKGSKAGLGGLVQVMEK